MNPARLNFNPHLFHYGGCFIYTVGAALKIASFFNWVHLTPDLSYYFTHPEAMAKIYLAGRLVVVCSVLLSAFLLYLLGQTQLSQGRLAEAEESFRRAVQVAPDQFETTRDLFVFLWDNKRDYAGAVQVLDDWLGRHPQDQQVRRARTIYADSAALLSGGGRARPG